MAKSSRAESDRHRRQIIDAASRLLREHGQAAISVQKIMSEVGLTHGGFYKHFSSKDELMDLAAERSFSELLEVMKSASEASSAPSDAWTGFIESYLSAEQREDLGGGCASTALATDSTRAGAGSGMRDAYVHGVSETLDALKQYQDHPGDPAAYRARLQALITMVGALTLARGTAGTPLAEDFADAAMTLLLEGDRRPAP